MFSLQTAHARLIPSVLWHESAEHVLLLLVCNGRDWSFNRSEHCLLLRRHVVCGYSTVDFLQDREEAGVDKSCMLVDPKNVEIGVAELAAACQAKRGVPLDAGARKIWMMRAGARMRMISAAAHQQCPTKVIRQRTKAKGSRWKSIVAIAAPQVDTCLMRRRMRMSGRGSHRSAHPSSSADN